MPESKNGLRKKLTGLEGSLPHARDQPDEKMASRFLRTDAPMPAASSDNGKTYDAFIVLDDDGTKSSYRLEFGK